MKKIAKKKSWFKIIEHARRIGSFTEQERYNAADWVTCACGEQDKRIPRWGAADWRQCEYQPKDKILAGLGQDFYNAVLGKHFDYALRVLFLIELRSELVLKRTLARRIR